MHSSFNFIMERCKSCLNPQKKCWRTRLRRTIPGIHCFHKPASFNLVWTGHQHFSMKSLRSDCLTVKRKHDYSVCALTFLQKISKSTEYTVINLHELQIAAFLTLNLSSGTVTGKISKFEQTMSHEVLTHIFPLAGFLLRSDGR